MEDEVVAATFKILVLGESNVGKSSLIKSYATRKKPAALLPTIGKLKCSMQRCGRVLVLRPRKWAERISIPVLHVRAPI